MKIVVLVKQVPDTWSEKRLNPTDGTLDREGVDAVVNEMDEYAIEEALRLAEVHGGEVTVVSMGPEKAAEAIRKALQMGADRGLHVVDDALKGSDAPATSLVLARALERVGDYDLVVAGSEASDGQTSMVPAMLAERLGLPQLTFARKVEADPGEGTVRIERLTDDGYWVVEARLPAVVSVVEKINEPRYPSFKGIMAAKKKPVDSVSVADLELDKSDVGLDAAWTRVESFTDRPPRTAGTVVTDEGDGGVKLVEFLASRKFV
jgi:electron transfer flavoprotein beta subunit